MESVGSRGSDPRVTRSDLITPSSNYQGDTTLINECKDPAMTERKRSAQQQVADEAARKAQNPNGARQTIADSQADPEFQENHKRLRAERLAREVEGKAGR